VCALWKVSDAGNVGTMLRTMACLNFQYMLHVSNVAASDAEAEGFTRRLAAASRGCSGKDFARRVCWTADGFVAHCGADGSGGGSSSSSSSSSSSCSSSGGAGEAGGDGDGGDGDGRRLPRLPIVAIETAPGAQSMYDFAWPERCMILVGSEGCGIHGRVLEKLRPGYDALVIIPTPGAHKSFNVATAFGMALFSYRQQWPGHTVAMDMASARQMHASG